MKKLTKHERILTIVLTVFIFAFIIQCVVLAYNNYLLNKEKDQILSTKNTLTNSTNLTPDSVIGNEIRNTENGCFTEKDLPKSDEYAEYKLQDCGIGITFLKKSLSILDVLDKNYESLYASRLFFDKGIKKLHDSSNDMKFIWDPEKKYNPYSSYVERSENHSYFNSGKYKIDIVSPTDLNGESIDDKDLYTKITISENGKELSHKEYKEEGFRFIYKIILNKTEYYLLGLCHDGMHGCQLIVPIVYNEKAPVIGKEFGGDFSNYLREDDFFTKNGELYTVIDDSRYFFQYSSSNNASYNSAVPLIIKFDKNTANTNDAMFDFIDLYKKSTDVMTNDLNTLKKVLSVVENKETRINLMNLTNRGTSLIPFFDYYLGMSIISNQSSYSSIRNSVKNMYLDFYGNNIEPEAHFDGYKDYEK